MYKGLGELHIDVTSRCNLRCGYCYFYIDEEQRKPEPEPSTTALKALMDEAEAIGCGEITLTGGEPLLRKDICKLLAHGDALKTLLTNGLLLDRGMVDALDKLDKLKEVKVSLDGFEGHDRIRGEGSSSRILNNLEYLDGSSEIPYVINTILSRYNVDDLLRLYKYVRESSCYRWAIDVPAPIGRAIDGDIVSYGEHLFSVIRKLIRQFIEDGAPFKLHIMNIFHSELMVNLEDDTFSWFDDQTHPCDYYIGGFTIRIDRTVAFCPSLPLSFGRLGEDQRLVDIVAGSEYARWAAMKIADIPECIECRYRGICGSGCRADAFLTAGKLDAVDESACIRMRFFESDVLPLLPEEAKELLCKRIVSGHKGADKSLLDNCKL